jgi:ferredoxin
LPTVEFLENPIGRAKVVEVPEGGALVDVCDEYRAPVPFSCRSATCGTCQIDVLEGLELFEPAELDERELLDLIGGAANHRLACQARLRPVPGRVRLRPAGG